MPKRIQEINNKSIEPHYLIEYGSNLAIQKNRTLFLVAIMFAILSALLWSTEIFDIPYKLLGGPQTHNNLQESALETLAILIVGIIVMMILIDGFNQFKEA